MNHRNDLITLAILAATNRAGEIPRFLSPARLRRLSSNHIIETLLEVHLFAGFPATIEGLKALPSSVITRKPMRERNVGAIRRKGVTLCRRVYGAGFPTLTRHLTSLHPDFATWILEYGYGRVLSRPGLDILTKELIAVAVLCVLGWERQFESHIRGAINVGGTRDDVMAAVKRSLAFMSLTRGGIWKRRTVRILGDFA